MSQPLPPPSGVLVRYGKVAVAAVLVVLLAVFAIGRITAPRPAGTAVASGGAKGGGAGDPSLTGSSMPDDLIMARQLLMDGNQTALTDIEDATGSDANLAALKAEAFVVYTNLTVAPHLFPSSTKPVIAPDGTATPATAASPKIWDNFAAFYGAFTDAASLAYDMSDVQDLATLRDDEKMLRADCDACHAKNMVAFTPGAPVAPTASGAAPSASAPARTAAAPAATQPLVPLGPQGRPGSDAPLTLSADDAAKLKAWIAGQKTPSVDLPGTLALGATLPLLVGLYPIAAAAGVPAAADYEYAVVNNQIVVANFSDHKIVYVFG